MRTQIAPSILAADFGRLADEARAVSAAGADLIHVDVMDGHFVPNLTVGPALVAALRRATELPLDIHLMIEQPERLIDDFARAGADLITVHAETCRHLHRVLQQVRGLGKRVGVALNPASPLDFIRYVLEDLDLVLLMTVNPGFSGQSFIPHVLPKIRELRAEAEGLGLTLDIQVDGGIKLANVDRVAEAGANVFVSGSGIFSTPDYAATIHAMRQRAQQAAELLVR
jgi:ribulose-phosphate 3-epimerase